MQKRSEERFFIRDKARLQLMKTLLTGGAGYIGSHTAIELLGQGHEVVIFDNFSNSHPEAIRRVEQITGRTIAVINGDVRDQAALEQALREHGIDSVVHFAGKKAVGESVANLWTTTTTTSTAPWCCCAP
jgi:UDP-glucose 4-epimerase